MSTTSTICDDDIKITIDSAKICAKLEQVLYTCHVNTKQMRNIVRNFHQIKYVGLEENIPHSLHKTLSTIHEKFIINFTFKELENFELLSYSHIAKT